MLRSNGPGLIVKIELWIDTNQVHIGFVKRLKRSDVPPICVSLAIFVLERKCKYTMAVYDGGNDVLAEVMLAFRIVGILSELFKEKPSVKDIDSHRSHCVPRIVWNLPRLLRFFLKADNALIGVDLHHSKFFCRFAIDSQSADG